MKALFLEGVLIFLNLDHGEALLDKGGGDTSSKYGLKRQTAASDA